jgi:acetylornithine deacetylase/succinyl-diaminopimelate desuccinylase-like protein
VAAAIDWDRATAEATQLLSDYLRIDTSNPPGNEALAVDFLGRLLDAEGIAFERAESAPGRSNLFARLGPADGGVCLLNHTDVVPVERQYWEVEPFAGLVRDGVIWGRGALDMKGMGIIELMTFLLLKRHGVPLRRSVTFLAAADEEAGSTFGVSWIAAHRPAWLDTELVINEGAYGLTINPKLPPIFQVAPSEKVPLWVKLTVNGRPGHGSVPHGDNCAEHLVEALARIAKWQHSLRITPLMAAHVEAMARAGALNATDEAGILRAAARSPALRARLANTVSLTTINTGIKVNVIPATATATLDCRLLPDVDVDAFLDDLRAVLADERVTLETLNRFEGSESSMDTEFVRTVSEVVTELVEGAHLAPEMTSGFTDSRIYRVRGIPAYGFVPCLVPPEELAGVHGHNERISVDNLRLGMQILYEVVRRLVAA